MKPNEPSRTAYDRPDNELLIRCSIMAQSSMTPLPWKILREDEKEVLQFANGHPLAQHRTWDHPRARSRIAEDALSESVEKVEGFGRSSSLAPARPLSLSGIPMARDRSVSMRWTTLRRSMEMPALG